MSQDFVAFQSPEGGGFVELSRSTKGKLFRKQILPMNSDFTHPGAPGKKIHVTPEFAKSLVENFKKGGDIVQVPVVNDANQHVEDPLRNAGEVVDLTYDSKGVWATIDARKYADDFGKTILGCSALMHLNYPDTRTGVGRGPTLLHVAATNRPYLNNLADFEELAVGLSAMSADTSDEKPVLMIPATKTEDTMDLSQIKAALKEDHGIDLDALQESADANSGELVTALSNVLGTATGRNVGSPEGAVAIKDVADAVIELAEERVALSAQVETLSAAAETAALEKAANEVDSLIAKGRILPKSREVMIGLSRSDRDTFDALVPDSAIVALSADGVDVFDTPKNEKLDTEIARLSALANGK